MSPAASRSDGTSPAAPPANALHAPLFDCHIAENLRAMLAARQEILHEALNVHFSRGHATLRGNVRSAPELSCIDELVRTAAGVCSFRNLVLIDPQTCVENARVAREAATAINLTHGLRDHGVRVEVTGALAVLSGHVESVRQKRRAEAVVRQFRSITIQNEIILRPRRSAE